MEQLTQKLKDGTMRILETPVPSIQARGVLVKAHFTLISAGTDRGTVEASRANYLEKARARPEQLKQVLDVVRSQGVGQAYRAVMKKLDSYSPLGYSCAGEVINVCGDVAELSVGGSRGLRRADRVSC